MNAKDKYLILEQCEFLGDIFNYYKDYTGLNIEDPNLVAGFFLFLEEILHDGAIVLCDYRENPRKILTGLPKEQVDKLRDIWPDMDEMLETFPEDPWYYVEWFWWRATCPIELDRLPQIEIYQSQ